MINIIKETVCFILRFFFLIAIIAIYQGKASPEGFLIVAAILAILTPWLYKAFLRATRDVSDAIRGK